MALNLCEQRKLKITINPPSDHRSVKIDYNHKMFFRQFLSNISEHLFYRNNVNIVSPQHNFSFDISEAYSEPSQTSKMKLSTKIFNS